jgi:hypothetical protein
MLKDIIVMTVDGRVLMAHQGATDKITVSVLPAGLYLLQGSRADGSRVSARFFRS